MMLQRIVAFIMTAIAAATLAIMSQSYTYSAAIVLVSLIGLPGRLQWNLPNKLRGYFLLIMTAAFALKHRLAPFDNEEIGFMMFPFVYAVGQYFLAVMAVHFYWPHENRLPAALVLPGFLVVMAAGDVTAEGQTARIYQLLVIAFLVVATMYSITLRRPATPGRPRGGLIRPVTILIILTSAVGLGMLLSSTLYSNQKEAYFLLQQIDIFGRGKDAVGFRNSAKLGSISKMKLSDSSGPALRVFADDAPGYLRARVFETYANSGWNPPPGRGKNITPLSTSKLPADFPPLAASGETFEIIPTSRSPWRVMNVWPAPEITDGMFTPLGTAVVRAPVKSIQTDENFTIDSNIRGGLNYAIAQPDTPTEKLPARNRKRYLQIPGNLDASVPEMAKKIFEDCKTPERKFAAVKKYFADNYKYELGIQVPKGQDSLNYFLLDKPPAHCEFFASGAAILLRLADVPTRYVTGFVAEERSPYGGYWLARHKDAHTWVEAWDDSTQQWVIVEATPAAGLPGGETRSKLGYLWDYINFRFQELRVAIYLDGFKGFGVWLWHRVVGLAVILFTTWQGGIVLVVLVVVTIFRRLRRRARKPKARPCSKMVLAMNALLCQLDAKLKKRKINRTSTETLDQFATRLENELPGEYIASAGHWYRHYAALRYRGEITEENLAELGQKLKVVLKQFDERK